MSNYPIFSIIIPTYNEERNIRDCLKSLGKLDYPRAKVKIIIADGNSTDKTRQIAKQFGTVIAVNRKKTVASGRNAGYCLATGQFIAFTDADCTFDQNWLKNSLPYFKDKQIAGVGGPNLTPETDNNLAKALGFVMDQEIFAAGSIHARKLDHTVTVRSLPGANSLYRREILDKVMPQNERLLTCDETEMNYRLGDLGYQLLYTPNVIVYHKRRNNFKGIFKQFYRYAIGRRQLKKMRKDGTSPVHWLVGFSFPLFLLFLILFPPFTIGIISLYFILAIWVLRKTKSPQIAGLVPLVVAVVGFSWSLGFTKEIIFPTKIR